MNDVPECRVCHGAEHLTAPITGESVPCPTCSLGTPGAGETRTLCPVTYCHRTIAERGEKGCAHCNHAPDVRVAFKVGDRVMFRGIENEIFANGDRPGTFDICQPGWPAGTDRWLNVPPDQLTQAAGAPDCDNQLMPQSTKERQEALRARRLMLGMTEVRGIYLHPDQHTELKAFAKKLARRREAESRKTPAEKQE